MAAGAGFYHHGRKSPLGQYDDYRKVEVTDGLYRILNRRIAMRHRLSVGTIVSDAMMKSAADRRRIYRRDRRMVHLQAQPGRCFYPGRAKPGIRDDQRHVGHGQEKPVGQIDRAQLDGRTDAPSAPTWVSYSGESWMT